MSKDMTRVYHWTANVRANHWLRFLSFVALLITGLYIHNPFMSGEHMMTWNRFIHLVAGYGMLFVLIFRTYMMFFSPNKEERDWAELFPTPANLAKLPQLIKYYMFLSNEHPTYKRYNPIQGPVYVLMALLIMMMAVTGLAIHHGGWLSGSFAWVNTMLGGEPVTRVVHVLGMWVMIALVLAHIYLVLRQDMLEKDRTFMSMIDGYVLRAGK